MATRLVTLMLNVSTQPPRRVPCHRLDGLDTYSFKGGGWQPLRIPGPVKTVFKSEDMYRQKQTNKQKV